MRLFLLFTILILIILSGGLYIGIIHVAPYAIVQPPRVIPQQYPQHFTRGTTPEEFGLNAAEIQVQVPDRLQNALITLNGWFVSASRDSIRGTIIFLHGVGGCKEQLLGAAEWLGVRGYNTVLYDSRAQGSSGGEFVSYGYYEREDVSAVIDTIQVRFGRHLPIGIWGNSFGGAVAILALEKDSRLDFGIIESTFASLPEITADYMQRMVGIGPRWLSDPALREAGKIANFLPWQIQPEQSAKEINQPILVIHGGADIHVKPEYGNRIFEAIPHKHKEWYLVPKAAHYDLWATGGLEYESRIEQFLKKSTTH